MKDTEEIKSSKSKSSKIVQSLNLPVICNMNPRSAYNKIDELHEFVKEEQVDLLFLSESWERENMTLKEIITLEDHEVISNVGQRSGIGGRPAIIANKVKFDVQDLTNKLIQIPWGVEAEWCILTPKNMTVRSEKLLAVLYIQNRIQERNLCFWIIFPMLSIY